MLNQSFLEPFQKNYDSFLVFQGALPLEYFGKDSYFDLKNTLLYYFKKANINYDYACNALNRKPDSFDSFEIKKDKSGNVYMEVVGADLRTKIIIRRDIANSEDYKGMKCFNISEVRFALKFRKFQEERIEKVIEANNLPRSVFSFSDFDTTSRMGSKDVTSYVKYLENEYFESAEVCFYDEAESSKRFGIKHVSSISQNYERKNDIIDFSKRRASLVKFKPDKMIKFKSRNKGNDLVSFIYKKDNYLIAFCEPISGVAWSRLVFLKNEDYNDEELIDKLLKKIELSNEDAALDKFIVNSSHTTYERFNANLAFLLGDVDDLDGVLAAQSFKKSVTDAKEKISR